MCVCALMSENILTSNSWKTRTLSFATSARDKCIRRRADNS